MSSDVRRWSCSYGILTDGGGQPGDWMVKRAVLAGQGQMLSHQGSERPICDPVAFVKPQAKKDLHYMWPSGWQEW